MTRWDVAVVGGGPAGACAARVATNAGLRVVLLERDQDAPKRICGEYLCPGAVRELRALGLGRALLAARTRPLVGMRLFSPSGTEIVARFPTEDPGLSVRRCELDPLLVDASGAEVRRGARVVAVGHGSRSVHVRLADGTELESAVLIGADGRNSIVARESGLRAPVSGRRVTLHAYCSGVSGTGAFGEMHLPGDGSYFGLNPGPDGRVNVTYVCDLAELGDRLAARAPGLLWEALTGCSTLRDRFSRGQLCSSVGALAPLEVRTKAVTAGLIVLAGDAAGFLDPLTGEGLYGAAVSGRLAGKWTARALGVEPSRRVRELRGYAREHRRVLGKRVLNRALQWMLRHPRVLECVGGRLSRNRPCGDALIRVIGNVALPREILRPGNLLALAGLRR